MHLEGSRILVTGATGFIGTYLTERLLGAGAKVRILARNREKAAPFAARGAEVVIGDLTHPETLTSICDGCQIVCHSGAWLGSPYNRSLGWEVNVVGTETLASVARAAGVSRFVHLSSLAVYGPVRHGVVTEDSPLWRGVELYGDSKIGGEEALMGIARQGLSVVILRPGMVYGPRSRGWTLWCLDRIRRGYPMMVAGGYALARPVFIDNLIDAIVLAMLTRVDGQAFTILDPPVTWREWLGHYARMLNRPVRSVPEFAAMALATTAFAFSKLTRKPPRLRPLTVGYTVSDARYPTEKASQLLGWSPEVAISEAMKITERWLRDHDYLP